jgi:hypothetical protein
MRNAPYPSHDPRHEPVSLRWLNARLIVVVVAVAAVVSLIVVAATALIIQEQINGDLRVTVDRDAHLARRDAINGCDGANLMRGFARIATHHGHATRPDDHVLSDWLLRIRDCPATYDRARIVVLPPNEEVAFLMALSHLHRVAVREHRGHFFLVPIR